MTELTHIDGFFTTSPFDLLFSQTSSSSKRLATPFTMQADSQPMPEKQMRMSNPMERRQVAGYNRFEQPRDHRGNACWFCLAAPTVEKQLIVR